MGKEYCIQPGDNFHALAQRWGGTCDDFLMVNPSVDPLRLQIGQKIVLPEFKGSKGLEQYANIDVDQGQEFVGEYLDEVEMEIEGVHVRLRRIGEPKTPHEIHFLLPRTEIRKIQPAGECGPTEVQIMLSNLNVILSPRLVSGDGDSAEKGKLAVQTKTQEQTTPQLSQPQQQDQNQQTQFNFAPQYGQGAKAAY
ncbi:LysM peptidoglycan-binding domain-containing protein [Desulfosporosinus nitroreducens]|uniref:LysM peptidoglycan-binding domain-containing protein n=1 Tax=Desulfosporosinus nitroreducens TaxID=2018668 RepID=A0ABT8QQX1_9FIRM|nr:LysM domain-containing protein [Desulfosporosinus nitroreducens]MCO1600066.1 LysM peptidoglycan-binding domain-containing protein [Desulfosporosinus nitroreducens]MDO0822904.1 LysM peptidoglycan-binding domain-containing protein [Desulfosporosinus nitroreducens]